MISGSGSIAAQMIPASSRQGVKSIRAAYLRVSTVDQSLSLQESLIEAQKPDRLYSDRDSGTNCTRAGYIKLIEAIECGSIEEVVVYRLDRLGRDPLELIRFFDLLEKHQVKFKSLTEP